MLGIIPVPQYISNILYLPGYDIRLYQNGKDHSGICRTGI